MDHRVRRLSPEDGKIIKRHLYGGNGMPAGYSHYRTVCEPSGYLGMQQRKTFVPDTERLHRVSAGRRI